MYFIKNLNKIKAKLNNKLIVSKHQCLSQDLNTGGAVFTVSLL